MESIKHILVATDGSELSLKAAALGGTLARALGASVSVVTVIDERMVVAEAWGDISAEDARRKIENRASKQEIKSTVEAVGGLPAPPRAAVLMGHPGDELCDFAKRENVDLIVMSSHGRTGIKRALLGSVSYTVVNQAPCAVTIVR
jgi:nucleotide-binding universal stress UspA family protein